MWYLIVLLILLFIAVLPVGLIADYNANGARVLLTIGPVRVLLYPSEASDKKNKQKTDAKGLDGAKQGSRSGGKLADILPILRTALEFLDNLRRRIKVNDLEATLTLAGNDPCDLSVNYGRAWAAVGNLQPHLNRLFDIRKQDIRVVCDYVAEETTIRIHAELSIAFIRLLILVVRYGVRILKQYMNVKNQRKGGMRYEPESSSNA